MLVRGFYDDSEQDGLLIMAGWVADYTVWESFTEDWRTALDTDPRIPYFKHHDASRPCLKPRFFDGQQDEIFNLLMGETRSRMNGSTPMLT